TTTRSSARSPPGAPTGRARARGSPPRSPRPSSSGPRRNSPSSTTRSPTRPPPFPRDVPPPPAFARGDTHTGFLAEPLAGWRPDDAEAPAAVITAALAMARATRPATDGPAAHVPTPWETLGGWRLGL